MSHNSGERRHSRKSTIKEERKTKENNIYNWLVAYFSEHSHCTTRRSLTTSLIRAIPTDVWSPSDISQYNSKICHMGPASYDVTASDLAAVSPGNILCKYTDDTYIISQRRMLTSEPQNCSIYTVFQKNPCDYVFDDNLNSKRPIVIIFGTVIT